MNGERCGNIYDGILLSYKKYVSDGRMGEIDKGDEEVINFQL